MSEIAGSLADAFSLVAAFAEPFHDIVMTCEYQAFTRSHARVGKYLNLNIIEQALRCKLRTNLCTIFENARLGLDGTHNAWMVQLIADMTPVAANR
jgi:hypothetical protein